MTLAGVLGFGGIVLLVGPGQIAGGAPSPPGIMPY
jgi:hypothetical protein